MDVEEEKKRFKTGDCKKKNIYRPSVAWCATAAAVRDSTRRRWAAPVSFLEIENLLFVSFAIN